MFFAHQMVPPDAAADPADGFGFFDDGYGCAFFPSAQRRTQSANARARYYDVVMVRHSVSSHGISPSVWPNS